MEANWKDVPRSYFAKAEDRKQRDWKAYEGEHAVARRLRG